METLTTWFSVFDLFGGDPPMDKFYPEAVKLAEQRGYTFTAEVWQQMCQNVQMP